MKTFIFAIMCSLLFVVPSVADGIEAFCSNSVANNVVIYNPTEVDYGYVGIQSIDTTIEGGDLISSRNREILKYDDQKRVVEYRETVSEFGEVVSEEHTVITSFGSIPGIPNIPWVQRLRPAGVYAGVYNTIVFTGWAGYDATYTVGVKVTKLEYVERKVFGPRGRRIIIPAYYRPLPEQEVATVRNSFIFNMISTEVSIPVR